MNHALKFSTLIIFITIFVSCESGKRDQWQEDFRYQTVSARPALEVNYTDSSRTAFQILAGEYEVTGQLEKPHLLFDKHTNVPWLWMEMLDESGKVYSTKNAEDPSRINLY